jgi:NAD kinase
VAHAPSRSRPRVVLVTRKTSLEGLRESRGTLDQVRFYLASRGQDIAWHQEAHDRFVASYAQVEASIPADQRRVRIDRGDLDRFLFAPDDLIVVVGQDGLVANVAKYLSEQRVIGINSDPERFDGVLCRHPPGAAKTLLDWAASGAPEMGERVQGFRIETRTMALAEREDGQTLLALNEVFIGHRTHQSARYTIEVEGETERHSSSGVLCATGTGATGWARSICEQRKVKKKLPRPTDPRLVWMVREPFPSVSTGVGLDFGLLPSDARLVLHSEMAEGGAIFADGIETDALEFLGGHTVTVRRADQALHLVVPAERQEAKNPPGSETVGPGG